MRVNKSFPPLFFSLVIFNYFIFILANIIYVYIYTHLYTHTHILLQQKVVMEELGEKAGELADHEHGTQPQGSLSTSLSPTE